MFWLKYGDLRRVWMETSIRFEILINILCSVKCYNITDIIDHTVYLWRLDEAETAMIEECSWKRRAESISSSSHTEWVPSSMECPRLGSAKFGHRRLAHSSLPDGPFNLKKYQTLPVHLCIRLWKVGISRPRFRAMKTTPCKFFSIFRIWK